MPAATEHLHASAAQLALLFSGRTITLKKEVDKEAARRYASGLHGIDMLVAVEMQASVGLIAAPPLAAPEPLAPAINEGPLFSHVETFAQTPLMRASDMLHAEEGPPVELDFTQTMVDHQLIATHPQQICPIWRKPSWR